MARAPAATRPAPLCTHVPIATVFRGCISPQRTLREGVGISDFLPVLLLFQKAVSLSLCHSPSLHVSRIWHSPPSKEAFRQLLKPPTKGKWCRTRQDGCSLVGQPSAWLGLSGADVLCGAVCYALGT